MPEAYIYDHVRTPRGKGKPDGALHEVTPVELLTQVLEAIRDRSDLDTSVVDEIVIGCVSQVGEQGGGIARVAALNAGFAETAPGQVVHRFCSSGLDAVNAAAAQIMAGQADAAVGGGVESMSRVPMGSDGGAWPADPQVAFKTYFAPQGIGADLIATLYGYSRESVDAFAVGSQQRASHAWDEGYFDSSVVAVHDQLGESVLDRDENLRPGTSADDLASLKPSFAKLGEQLGFDDVAIQRYPEVERIEHVHHAGNSSGIVDGAAAVLLGDRQLQDIVGKPPRARVRGFASIGTDPTIMLTGPAPSAEKVLKRCGMSTADIDLFELNEAFAAVVLRFMDLLDIPRDKINVNGGAIAMGHPLGATGAMILGTVLDELERRDLNTALINLCVGAGMGTATVIERV